MDLNVVWFFLLGTLLAGYAVLDGFDLGVGIMHPAARSDHERRIFLNAIGPIWDGNEVWLITFGGALFAAFPEAYATVFSGFYTAFMLLLAGLVFRAVSIEFRSKVASARWRKAWDFGFFASSLLISILFGVAVGNSMIGIPLDERGNYWGGLQGLLRPYPILVGLLVASLFALHGVLYLYLKVPRGELHLRIRQWMWHAWGVFLVLYLLATITTLIMVPRAIPNFERLPWMAAVVLLQVIALANIPRAIYRDLALQAFASSCTVILCLVGLFGAAMWPNLVTASNDPRLSLTIFDASSSPGTLKTMLIIACIGIPLVLAYTTLVYWTFRRRVEVTEHGY